MTERQELILQMFAEDKSLSRERICEKTGLSDGTIKREIAFLKKSGYLKRIGSLKYFFLDYRKSMRNTQGFPLTPPPSIQISVRTLHRSMDMGAPS